MSIYFCSPLRYPGGKAAITPLLREVLLKNKLRDSSFAEPYAGGAGLSLALLFAGDVSDVHLNDIDLGIYSFWNLVIHNTSKLLDKVNTIDVDLAEWHRQRAILCDPCPDPDDLGFATFFLNRTNHSGIVPFAGPIGGRNQTGKYKIDCRFHRENLSNRIKRIACYGHRIHLSNLDAKQFLQDRNAKSDERRIFYIDPPYVQNGRKLYINSYEDQDHFDISREIRSLRCPWLVTYDNVHLIHRFYDDYDRYEFDINYSLNKKRRGQEVLIASHGLSVPLAKAFGLRAVA